MHIPVGVKGDAITSNTPNTKENSLFNTILVEMQSYSKVPVAGANQEENLSEKERTMPMYLTSLGTRVNVCSKHVHSKNILQSLIHIQLKKSRLDNSFWLYSERYKIHDHSDKKTIPER